MVSKELKQSAALMQHQARKSEVVGCARLRGSQRGEDGVEYYTTTFVCWRYVFYGRSNPNVCFCKVAIATPALTTADTPRAPTMFCKRVNDKQCALDTYLMMSRSLEGHTWLLQR
jgi:hypothetical protein